MFLFSVTAWTSLRGFLRAPPTTPPTSRIPLFPLHPHLFHPLHLQVLFMSPEFSRLQVPCVTSVKTPEAMGLPRPPLFGDFHKKSPQVSISPFPPLFLSPGIPLGGFHPDNGCQPLFLGASSPPTLWGSLKCFSGTHHPAEVLTMGCGTVVR